MAVEGAGSLVPASLYHLLGSLSLLLCLRVKDIRTSPCALDVALNHNLTLAIHCTKELAWALLAPLFSLSGPLGGREKLHLLPDSVWESVVHALLACMIEWCRNMSSWDAQRYQPALNLETVDWTRARTPVTWLEPNQFAQWIGQEARKTRCRLRTRLSKPTASCPQNSPAEVQNPGLSPLSRCSSRPSYLSPSPTSANVMSNAYDTNRRWST